MTLFPEIIACADNAGVVSICKLIMYSKEGITQKVCPSG